MQYLIAALLIVVLAFFFGCSRKRDASAQSPAAKAQVVGSADLESQEGGTVATQRDDLRGRLAVLAQEPPPELEPPMLASCYQAAVYPERAEYICPDCGEKTLFPEDDAEAIEWRRGKAQHMAEQIAEAGLDVLLDASEFCSRCNPDVSDPSLGLTISFDGETEPHRVTGVAYTDTELLLAFVEGDSKVSFIDDRGGRGKTTEQALRDLVPRLEELLGVDLDE